MILSDTGSGSGLDGSGYGADTSTHSRHTSTADAITDAHTITRYLHLDADMPALFPPPPPLPPPPPIPLPLECCTIDGSTMVWERAREGE